MTLEIAQGIPFDRERLERSWAAVHRAGEGLAHSIAGQSGPMRPWERYHLAAYSYVFQPDEAARVRERLEKQEKEAEALRQQEAFLFRVRMGTAFSFGF